MNQAFIEQDFKSREIQINRRDCFPGTLRQEPRALDFDWKDLDLEEDEVHAIKDVEYQISSVVNWIANNAI